MNLEERLKATIGNYQDFPSAGILFRDLNPVYADAALAEAIASEVAEWAMPLGINKVIGIESRGFILGAWLSSRLSCPFVPLRKAGKLPGPTLTESYDLEYGSAKLELQVGSVNQSDKVLIADDLLATGGTAAAAARLILSAGGLVSAFAFIIELEALNGRNQCARFSDNLISLARY